ncbi:cofilin/actin-depolymerizing factor homolog [Dermacentor albipictus]|uniref:cofilin/actin-depolymerizing factor homolog n=1 Tax=Dermacentor albipictus TaxID=60249 RepID=UPI0038FC1C7A
MSFAAVRVSDEAKAEYKALKEDKKHRYIVYHLKDGEVIDVEATGERSATYADFLEKVRQSYADECRWFVFDYAYTADSGIAREAAIFITWCPKQANVRQKMVYGSSRDTLRQSLAGISDQLEASTVEDVSQAAIDALVRK